MSNLHTNCMKISRLFTRRTPSTLALFFQRFLVSAAMISSHYSRGSSCWLGCHANAFTQRAFARALSPHFLRDIDTTRERTRILVIRSIPIRLSALYQVVLHNIDKWRNVAIGTLHGETGETETLSRVHFFLPALREGNAWYHRNYNYFRSQLHFSVDLTLATCVWKLTKYPIGIQLTWSPCLSLCFISDVLKTTILTFLDLRGLT